MSYPSPRFNTREILEGDSSTREILWMQFYKLVNTAEVLLSEGIIESATSDSLTQIACDFRVTLEAIDDVVKRSDEVKVMVEDDDYEYEPGEDE